MMLAYRNNGGGIIVAAEEKLPEEVNRYGVVIPARSRQCHRSQGRGGKAPIRQAPSNLCVIGAMFCSLKFFPSWIARSVARHEIHLRRRWRS